MKEEGVKAGATGVQKVPSIMSIALEKNWKKIARVKFCAQVLPLEQFSYDLECS